MEQGGHAKYLYMRHSGDVRTHAFISLPTLKRVAGRLNVKLTKNDQGILYG